MDVKQTAIRMANVLADKKAINPVLLDISPISVIADYFLIASGNNVIHVKALCDELEQQMAQSGLHIKRQDGYVAGRWVVLDYGDIIVHIFHPEEREFYNLERLWGDAQTEAWQV